MEIINNIIFLYIPTIYLLYSMGNMTFVFGEFQEKIHTVPKTLIYVGLKMIAILTLQVFIWSYSFGTFHIKYYIYLQYPLTFYILLELYLTNKLLKNYLNYIDKYSERIIGRLCNKEFNIIIEKITKRLIKCFKHTIYVLKGIIALLFLILIIYFQTNYSIFIFGILIIVLFTFVINLSILKN